MFKPEVRIIETQSEEVKSAEVSNWEKQQLLMKYGFINQSTETPQIQSFEPTRDLSYEEMMRLEEQNRQRELERRYNNVRNQPKSYTIDNDRVNYNETRWANADDINFGFEVNIVSDMKIPGMRY